MLPAAHTVTMDDVGKLKKIGGHVLISTRGKASEVGALPVFYAHCDLMKQKN
jgi:hypothetical protein